MLRIPALPFGVQACSVLPYQAKDRDGFVDTGNNLPGIDPHVYVSGAAVKEMAKLFGWHPPEAVEERDERIHELETRLADTEEQLAQADGYIDAIDTLESKGFTARKKPGRPRQKVET